MAVTGVLAGISRTAATPAAFDRVRLFSAFALVYLVWGSNYLAIQQAVETIPPFLAVALLEQAA